MSIEWKSTDSINFQEDTNMSMEWKSTDSIDLAERRAEQIIGPNNFQNPWFLKKGLARLAPVGLIPNNGTGFLISENLIMTNWHIFRDSSWAEDQEFILGFEQNEDGSTPQTQKFKLLPEKFFYSNEELDFAVVHADNSPGKEFGIINIFKPGKIRNDIHVNIIQHPNAGLKKIAIRDNGVKYFDEKIIQYWTDTEHGSSGSPVFDDQWEIIGLHYMRDQAKDISGGVVYYNEAHTITAITTELKKIFPTVF